VNTVRDGDGTRFFLAQYHSDQKFFEPEQDTSTGKGSENMNAREVQFLNPDEQEKIQSLVAAKVRLPAARVLVFLARTTEATVREIEKGTDQRQPHVCFALRQLMKQGWIEGHGKNPNARRWRDWTFCLARPLDAIVSSIGQDFNGEGRVWNIRVRGAARVVCVGRTLCVCPV
jgi:predicted transcriptional regulator